MCVGAATPKPRLDCVIKEAINKGQIPGPRYLAASQEITVTGSLGDDMLPHLPFPEMSFGQVVDGPEDMRKAVRMYLKYGVDTIKLNLSGDNLVPGADATTNWMSDEEVAIAVKEAKVRGKRVSCHARSTGSIKQAMRHGLDIVYHASFADEEALDMLEAAKDRVFVAPGISVQIRLLNEGEVVGIDNAQAKRMGYERELEATVKSMKAMLKRGIRVLPGGDYGFAWAPHGENAKDLEYFVKYLGMTPMETIVSATKWGGQMMMQGNELGEIREGYLADLLLVDGDPLANISILQNRDKLLAIMKDGAFHKMPDVGAAQRFSRSVA
jgi:imidazolonepropionase-like amidohydrolase